MICELTEKPTYLIIELRKQREFILQNIQFAETKLFNKKENEKN